MRVATHHFDEFTILDHHRSYDPEESFVRREKTCSASEGIALKHRLAGMFGKDLDDSSSVRARCRIPLEVPTSRLEYGIELVGEELVRGEDSERLWIPKVRLVS